MNKTEVMALLKENQNDRGVANWNKLGSKPKGMKSYGIGLTVLRKLAKQVGRDHDLALKLWNTNCYDAKVIGLLMDDPKQVTREQVEEQVDDVSIGMLAHVFSSCDATLAKVPFVIDLAVEWADHEDPVRRRCAYGLLYELSKSKKKTDALNDAFFLTYVSRIHETVADEENWVRGAMAAALMGIGKRNAKLNKAAIKVAKAVGTIDVDYGDDNSCEPLDVLKHLTSDYVKKKFGT